VQGALRVSSPALVSLAAILLPRLTMVSSSRGSLFNRGRATDVQFLAVLSETGH
jgi:hypothetical protein